MMDASTPELEPSVLEVIRELVRGGRERFALPEAKRVEVARRIEHHFEEDLRPRRVEGLLALVRLAKVLEHRFDSPTAAATLRDILRASASGRVLFSSLESRSQVFQDACEKYAGTKRTLPAAAAATSEPVAARGARPQGARLAPETSSPAAQAIRAAFLMTPGELEARRVKPSFSVRRRPEQTLGAGLGSGAVADSGSEVGRGASRAGVGQPLRGRRRLVGGV
ncbi:MAG: hypothetical protein H6729_01485 [Deltaproteobacteria bacterium]|nr:hypothetical protein [Deltaproteobacteria bacterium]